MAARMVAVAAALLVAGTVVGLAVVGRHGGGAIQGWDDRVQRWSVQHRGGMVGAAKVVAFAGDAPKLAVWVVVASAVWWLAERSLRSLVPLAAYLGGEFEVFAIRHVIHRHRPPTADFPAPGAVPGVHETSFSYPSGHAVAVTAVLVAVTAVAARTHRRWWPLALGVIASLYVADTRLVLGVHWFSDVTFGLLIGASWGLAVAWGSARVGRRPLGPPGRT